MYKTSAQYKISVFYLAPIGAMRLKAAEQRTSRLNTVQWYGDGVFAGGCLLKRNCRHTGERADRAN